jgi:hypothetical protein
MKTTRTYFPRLGVLAAAVMLCWSPLPAAGEHQHDHGNDRDHGHGGASVSGGGSPAKAQRLEGMAIHGLTMALQGTTLLMIGRTKASPTVDGIMVDHGREMFERGAEMLRNSEAGTVLADAMRNAGSELEKLETSGPPGVADTYRHMLIALNHALELVADGAILATPVRGTAGGGTAEHSAGQGREMIAGGRKIWAEVSEGKAMTEIHAMGMSPRTVRMMKAVHKFADAGGKVIAILEAAAGGE